jgi:ABC-type multidrug transport system permease subunit
MREFHREPEAVFWVYVFPIVLMVVLGLAFGRRAAEEMRVAVIEGAGAEAARAALDAREDIEAEVVSSDEAFSSHGDGKVDLVLEVLDAGYRFHLDHTRPEAAVARLKVNDALQRAAGRTDPMPAVDEAASVRSASYVHWLIPGLMGMNIMGGGMWGLGFVTVDLRMRKLLKRYAATPMRRSDFLLSLMLSRLLFLVGEMVVILVIGCLAFGLELRGDLASLAVVVLAGALGFAGIGLLCAARADKIETISGILNLAMVPMWLFSGVFFSAERFPDAVQPFVQVLPLTQLNNALRAVILDGTPAVQVWLPLLALALWGGVSFALALRWFRWR